MYMLHILVFSKVDFIYTTSKENFQKKIKFFNKIIVIKTNILEKLFYIIYFFIQGKPLQVGYFFSWKMKKKIEEIHENYDCIIFHLIRSGEFLPKNFKGKIINIHRRIYLNQVLIQILIRKK